MNVEEHSRKCDINFTEESSNNSLHPGARNESMSVIRTCIRNSTNEDQHSCKRIEQNRPKFYLENSVTEQQSNVNTQSGFRIGQLCKVKMKKNYYPK